MSKPTAYRPDIEGLRAVAVMSVVLYHAGVPLAQGGYVGVDVFFVISGFLITTQLLNDAASDRGIRIPTFYARRVRRLLPAATLTILVTLAGAAVLFSPVLQQTVRDDARSAAFFFSNLRFIAQARDYFHEGFAPSLFQHFWSLSVEEQFYVVWPAVMIFALHGSRGGREGRRRRLFAVLGVIIVASFIAAVRLTDTNQPFAFFSLPTRAWELGIGAALAVGARRIGRLEERWRDPLCVAGLALIAYAVLRYKATTPFPSTAALWPVLGSALVVASGIGAMSRVGARVVGWAPFETIGKYSYSLYLFHWPVLELAKAQYNTVGTSWKRALIVVALGAVPLTLVSYHLVEAPIRFHAKLKPNRAALTMAAACLALSALVLAVYVPLAQKPMDAGRTAAPITPGDLTPTAYVPSNITPPLRAVALGHPPKYKWVCGSDICNYGRPDAPKTVVLIGDSHAAMFRGAFYELARSQDWRVVTYAKPGCPSFEFKRDPRFPDCPEFRDAAFAFIAKTRPDVVVFSNHTPGVFAQTPKVWTKGVVDALARVPDDVPVAVIGQTLTAQETIPSCVALHIHNPQHCAPKRHQRLVVKLNAALAQLAAARGATFVDPIPWICSDTQCPVIVGNVLAYIDDDHLSGEFASSRAAQVGAALAPLVAS